MPFTKLYLLSYFNLFAKLKNKCVFDAAVTINVKLPNLVGRLLEKLVIYLNYSHIA